MGNSEATVSGRRHESTRAAAAATAVRLAPQPPGSLQHRLLSDVAVLRCRSSGTCPDQLDRRVHVVAWLHCHPERTRCVPTGRPRRLARARSIAQRRRWTILRGWHQRAALPAGPGCWPSIRLLAILRLAFAASGVMRAMRSIHRARRSSSAVFAHGAWLVVVAQMRHSVLPESGLDHILAGPTRIRMSCIRCLRARRVEHSRRRPPSLIE